MTGKRIGVGIVGTGVIASEHARTLLHLREQAQLVAAADLNPARLMRFGEAHFFPFACSSATELIERPDVDLVVVATPPSAHKAIVAEALEAGKYVICEKPIAHTLGEADAIMRHAEQFPGRLSISHQLRFDPDFQRFHALLTHPDIRKIDRVICRRVSPISPSVVRGWWGRWNVAGGGAVMTQFVHQLDLLCVLLGKAQWVEATASCAIPGLESEDTCEMKIGFDGDVIVDAFCSVADLPRENEFTVHGDFGSVTYPWSLSLKPDKASLATEAEKKFPLPVQDSRIQNLSKRIVRRGLREIGMGHLYPPPMAVTTHLPYHKAVMSAIRTGQPLPVQPADAWQSLELTTAIYVAAIENTRQTLPCPSDVYSGVGDRWKQRAACVA